MSVKFNNKNLTDFGLALRSEIKFLSAQKQIEEVKVAGRDGLVLLDRDRLESIDFPLSFLMTFNPRNYSNIEKQIYEAKDWLSNMTGFRPFEWAGDIENQYLARIVGQTSITRRNPRVAFFEVPFQFQPNKFVKTGLAERTLFNGESVVNAGRLPALPIIRITGTGNITLNIGEKDFVLKNLTDGAVIDCENQTVTNLSGTESVMQLVNTYPFPSIPLGTSVVEWNTQPNFSVSIIPKWRLRV
ncbi:MAG: phage tail family protein [Streptococcaceae bacterium]|nr:phage tail family protein [Streptococcaceae bacterium]MCL2680903.1 phage tail family protein [Streptococcaceae bacterium]MCL2858099.1 phage tail family protein [Streptococcaceae bacterium]